MATYWENSCSFGLRYVSWYKYLIVSLVFSHLGFWSGNLFLIAPFPDLCLLVPFYGRHILYFAAWRKIIVLLHAYYNTQGRLQRLYPFCSGTGLMTLPLTVRFLVYVVHMKCYHWKIYFKSRYIFSCMIL